MKLLHTADWHVGRTIRGRSRDYEHRQVLSEIAAIAGDEQVDLTLVAGDIFDTAAPSPAAEEIVYRALLDLAEVAPVVIVAGNHDNPARLRAVAPLLSLGRVTVGASIARPDDGGVVDFPHLAVRIALVPFIGKRGIVRVEEILQLGQAERIGEYAERVGDILEALTTGMAPDNVNLVVSHLMVAGGEPGGGERTAHLFDYAVPALAFPGHLSYVALGHLHRPQRVPAPVPMWYSGSPMQLDFGEGEDRKAVVLVEAEPGLPVTVTTKDLAGGRRLRTLRGTLAHIEAMADTVGDAYLRVELEEPARAGLADEVRALLPGAVEVRLALAPEGARTVPQRLGRDPSELFRDYLDVSKVEDPRLTALFDELLVEALDHPGGGGEADV
ncbi:MAG TPA: exonuclease SbcCD subunit D [Acidimicrobiia bacterium]|nr:exonuclease SbcCD subunit D [Acidimicrobiia bacterium]